MEILKIKLVKCMKMTLLPKINVWNIQKCCEEYVQSLCSKKYSMDNFKII